MILVVAVPLVVALLVAATVIVSNLLGTCGPDVQRRDGECVGVTDGSHVYEEPLRAVSEKIKAENDRVRGKPGVTLAVLMPMTTTDDASLSMEQIRSHIEGAYIAQRNANQSETNRKIRLVLANEGSKEQHWRAVVDQLVSMADDPQPLRVVTGLGLSVTETVQGAKALSRNGIPMVGSVISAVGLNAVAEGLGGPIEGLTRVRPDNSADLTAVADYLSTHAANDSAMLVYDSNQNDFYTSGLAADFKRLFRTYWERSGSLAAPFDGAPGSPGIESQFRLIVNRLCGPGAPNMVMYAGRATLLPDFVSKLRERGCEKDRQITVLTGSDATDLKVSLKPALPTDARVSVLYSTVDEELALGDQQWNPEDHAQFLRFKASFESHFDGADLRNGWAIMAHDAVLTAITAVHNAEAQSEVPPTLRDVTSHLGLLNHEQNSVPGASGTFTLNEVTGDRQLGRLPIIELLPDTTVRIRGVYEPPDR